MFPNQDHGRLSVTEAGTLVIEPVHQSDAGDYICQAISVAGNAYSKARLQVRGKDSTIWFCTGIGTLVNLEFQKSRFF